MITKHLFKIKRTLSDIHHILGLAVEHLDVNKQLFL